MWMILHSRVNFISARAKQYGLLLYPMERCWYRLIRYVPLNVNFCYRYPIINSLAGVFPSWSFWIIYFGCSSRAITLSDFFQPHSNLVKVFLFTQDFPLEDVYVLTWRNFRDIYWYLCSHIHVNYCLIAVNFSCLLFPAIGNYGFVFKYG